MLKVLLTGAGTPNAIGFAKGLRKGFGKKVFILGVDSSPLAPLFYIKDRNFCLDKAVIVPTADKKNYIKSMLSLCKKNKIKFLVPTTDYELLPIAQNKRLFDKAGTKCIISEATTIKACRDKWLTYNRLHKLVDMPASALPSSFKGRKNPVGFPAIVKPRLGSGSKNIFRVSNPEGLRLALKNCRQPLIQKFVNGKEYTIDCLVGIKGNVIGIAARARIAKLAGLSGKGAIVNDKKLLKLGKNLCSMIEFYGPINFQVLVERGKPYIIEINPRFSGTGILSIFAGFNLPHLCILDALGKKLPKRIKTKEGVIISRYVEDVFLEKRQLIKKTA